MYGLLVKRQLSQYWWWPHLLPIHLLWPSGVIWRHRFGWTFVQVMACCLTAPSHYLNQCWLIMNGVLWRSHKTSFTGSVWNYYYYYISQGPMSYPSGAEARILRDNMVHIIPWLSYVAKWSIAMILVLENRRLNVARAEGLTLSLPSRCR